MKNIDFTEDKSLIQSSDVLESEDTISFQTEIPKQIQQAMKVYIEKHPNWGKIEKLLVLFELIFLELYEKLQSDIFINWHN